jgi:imidazolonepropionase-like amidohydrolase
MNGGVTALQVLPGSANLFGGRGVTLKNVPARTVQGMKFPGAPYGLKMACGENPKRVYGSRNTMPQTRMGNIASVRQTWAKAQAYKRKWDRYERDGGEMPERDLAMDTLRGVLAGEIIIHNHCYRADEMALMIDVRGGRLQGRNLPPRGRELQGRRPACGGGHLLGDVGRLVRLQDGSL